MKDVFCRTEMLIGDENLDILSKSKIAVIGIGGVGSYTVEALARSGVGAIAMVDKDSIDKTNINRQIHANHHTIGLPKVDVMKERILAINPDIELETYHMEYNSHNSQIIDREFDYVVDAIDTLSAKVDLVIRCKEMGIPIISSMGAGNKMDPTAFKVIDIFKTHTDPIARIMRGRLREAGIDSLKVVWSDERPIKRHVDGTRGPSSIAFVPSVAGLVMAGEVIKDLISWEY